MFLDLAQAVGFMLAQTDAFNNEKNWFIVWCRNQICNQVLFNVQSFISEANIEAIIHNPSFASLSKNDCVVAAVNDIEDVFFKAIYCCLVSELSSLP